MYSKDAMFVGDHFFWDFTQKVSHIVLFQYKRLIEDKEADVESEIRSLFEKVGLWEDYINIIKTVAEEVSGGPPQAISTYFGPNKYDIDFGETGYPKIPICVVSYTREESMRLSKGKSRTVDLEIEDVRNRLINVHKWIALNKFKDLL